MNKIIKIISLSLLVAITLFSCKKKEETRIQTSWSSKDPFSIPFNTRKNQFKLENLAYNGSFEMGKILIHESNIKTFTIDGWKVVGENVEWVNQQNVEYKFHEVFDGNSAVKIIRTSANETETTGDGVISDFIKVIPGNYFLKLHMKFKDIQSQKARLGYKLQDAVHLQVRFYDKNRIELKVNECNPFQNSRINTSFNSLSLANFWEIERTDWMEVHGKAAFYPYYNGDIPDKARYARIFIGLKGTGTLWVDDVDFRFTKENFTLLECMETYFDSSVVSISDSLKLELISNDSILPKTIELILNSDIDGEDVDFLLNQGVETIYYPLNKKLIANLSVYKKLSLLIDGNRENDLELFSKIKRKDAKKIETVLIKNFNSLDELESVLELITNKNANIRVRFVPIFNSLKSINTSKGEAQNYFDELSKFKLELVWTGENTLSNSIDDINMFSIEKSMGQVPVYLDKNINRDNIRISDSVFQEFYVGKIRLQSLFEPYCLNISEGAKNRMPNNVLIELDSLSEFRKIQLLTTLDYYKSDKYNSEKSLWYILNKRYGRDMSISLIKFNDAVFGIKELAQKIKNHGLNNKEQRIITIYKSNLEKEFELIKSYNPEEKLIGELEVVKTETLRLYDEIF